MSLIGNALVVIIAVTIATAIQYYYPNNPIDEPIDKIIEKIVETETGIDVPLESLTTPTNFATTIPDPNLRKTF